MEVFSPEHILILRKPGVHLLEPLELNNAALLLLKNNSYTMSHPHKYDPGFYSFYLQFGEISGLRTDVATIWWNLWLTYKCVARISWNLTHHNLVDVSHATCSTMAYFYLSCLRPECCHLHPLLYLVLVVLATLMGDWRGVYIAWWHILNLWPNVPMTIFSLC